MPSFVLEAAVILCKIMIHGIDLENWDSGPVWIGLSSNSRLQEDSCHRQSKVVCIQRLPAHSTCFNDAYMYA